MEEKLDKIIEKQIAIQVDLQEHMRRTELNETRIKRLEDYNGTAIRHLHNKVDTKVDTKLFFWGLGASTMLVTLAIALAKFLA